MRVLHLISTLGGGGAERQIGVLAQGLRELACEVHVGIVTPGVHLDRVVEAGAIVHRIAARGNHDPLLPLRVARLIRRVKPDVVQTWLMQMDVIGGAAAIVTRVPWIISERTHKIAYSGHVKNRLRRWLGRFASGIVANSRGGAEYWDGLRVPSFVVPNALPLDRIAAAPRDGDGSGEAPVVLFVGRFDPAKNLPTLIEAAGRVLTEKKITLVLCGEGPMESEIREQVTRAGIAEQVRFPGFSDRVWSLMKRADVLVAPSWFEGQPNAVMEAAMCGCPLVLSDIPAHRECIGEGAALYADPADAGALARAILLALDDRESARARAERARAMAAQCSVERAAAAYLEAYHRVTS